ncbi:MAG: late competence development ComFB family protein [Negativicutes bacterium]|nr:late competence development ComFB family protein [Negativicutes bacterium]
MQLKNFMEELVWEQLDKILSTKDDICKCEKCRYDIAALTLNTLPPRYFVTDIGETLTRVKSLEQQFATDVVAALVNAIIIVKSRPHHA